MKIELVDHISYEINGRIYTFIKLYWDGGYLYGTCKSGKRRGKRALLMDDLIQFDGEPIVLAKKIS